MFRKISRIKVGVFDLEWDKTVRSKNNVIIPFEKVNIIYGNNYSGKTTLAKIFRAVETKTLPPKYSSFDFSIECDDGVVVTQSSIQDCQSVIRVFNKDFVRESLAFLVDEEEDISPFVVLGEDNKKDEAEITKLQSELGSEEEKDSLCGRLEVIRTIYDEADSKAKSEETELNDQLRDKARSIKEEPETFGDVNYQITKIKEDIGATSSDGYLRLDNRQRETYKNLLKDEPQAEISSIPLLNLQFNTVKEEADGLVTRPITISQPIQELLSNFHLENWVRKGLELHAYRDKCGFCGQILPTDLTKKLDQHFNQESRQLTEQIKALMKLIKKEELPKVKKETFFLI